LATLLGSDSLQLKDNAIDAVTQLVTNDPAVSQHVNPHTDYLGEFPFLGTPHS